MAKEDYKGQFKSLSKQLGSGYSVKTLKNMSDKKLEELIRLQDYMDSPDFVGFSKGGNITSKKSKFKIKYGIVDNLKNKK